ncbi:FitA-like ribbon-helix-helix domain-containing protein [Streptomyces alkaliterrae]|uniref:Antitoxin FitA-like ribbon-helix-helix domain-containing protein n=1 Tax=Streptomyces alkaliterrae TaxID=2213162 RepID=A0A5P0YR46_9ACTN|nr:hypothetical protein [Streptomyces alkaliterrae]MBB1252115.1 hypothetical protein [Streptomyces alkaliterrae]MBB1257575.1 hypothetical protein [Streptomyces alkaliterrae]MQS02801.1 hypothetical protein [Streptomyces alkaliterrae]
MATIHIREVREDTLATLKTRAARAGKSLQAYVLDILETEARTLTLDEALAASRDIAAGSGVTADDILDTIQAAREARAA